MSNFVEWVASADGARIVDPVDMKPKLNNQNLTNLLSRLTDWVNRKEYPMLPPSCITYSVRSSAQHFFRGKSIFMRHANAAVMYAKQQPNISIDWNVTYLPSTSNRTSFSTMHGWYGVIPKDIRNESKLSDIMQILTSFTDPQFQRFLFKNYGFVPVTWDALKGEFHPVII
jgi:hypothetical protein